MEPKSLTATGERTPVESISIRLAIGWVKLLPQPGTCNAVLISSISSFLVFFQRSSRSANGFSIEARSAFRSSAEGSRSSRFRSFASRLSSSRAVQVATPTARSKSSPSSALTRSRSRRAWLSAR